MKWTLAGRWAAAACLLIVACGATLRLNGQAQGRSAAGDTFSQVDLPLSPRHWDDAELMAAIGKVPDTTPGLAIAPLVNTPHYWVNVVRRTAPQAAIVHAGATEVHHIIDGTATLVLGGKLAPAATISPGKFATIDGGDAQFVEKGDVILIPPGTPHWYRAIDRALTYLEVRGDLAR